MANFKLFTNEVEKSLAIKAQIVEIISKTKHSITPNNFDVIICIGGDGTFLSCVHAHKEYLNKVKFYNINTGHLGFYSEIFSSKIEERFIRWLQQDELMPINCTHQIFDFNMLELCDGKQKYLALNEFLFKTQNKTLVYKMYVNGTFLQKIRGEGVNISSQSGSTAYSKSLGGAIIYPTLQAYQVQEIAPLNNKHYRSLNAPIIFSKNDIVELEFENIEHLIWSNDNFYDQVLVDNKITISIAKSINIQVISFNKLSYATVLQNAFLD